MWTPDGSLLYVSSLKGNRDIYLQKIGKDLKARGDPVRLTTGLNAHTIALDKTGTTLVYSVFTPNSNIYTVPIAGGPMRAVTTGTQTIENVNISPDGKWLLYDSNINGNQDIYKLSVDGGEPEQLTHNGSDNFYPLWSPDGKRIAYHSFVNGNRDVFVMDASGANVVQVTSEKREELAPIWIAEGKGLSFLVYPDSIFSSFQNGKTWSAPKFLGRFTGGSSNGNQMLVGAEAGVICTTCEAGLYLLDADGRNPRRVPLREIPKVAAYPGSLFWSPQSGVFGAIGEKDGSQSIWQIPLDGNPSGES